MADARLGRDGRTVRCGWTVGGRATCTASLGHITADDDGVPMITFSAEYKKIADAPTVLAFTNYALARLDRGEKPRPRRALKPRSGGTWDIAVTGPIYLAHDSREWPLPVHAPCRNGHRNVVTEAVLEEWTLSR